MAIYHLSVKAVNRRSGRSAPAAAAYRLAAKITDHARGVVHDYERRSGVAHVDLVLPANAPAWAVDPSQLWSAAERVERRCDARTAREVELALHAELTLRQNIDLARGFAQALTDRDGAAGHLAIHVPPVIERALRADPLAWDRPIHELAGGRTAERNVHAHLLRTTRRLGPDGLGAKTSEWDDSGGPDTVRATRVLWERLSNDALARAGHGHRIDHRSYREQGRLELPTMHLGAHATAKERLGIPTRRGDENRAIHERNALVRDVCEILELDEREIELRRSIDFEPSGLKVTASPTHAITGELVGSTARSERPVAYVDVGDRLLGVDVERQPRPDHIGEPVRIEPHGSRWELVFARLERAGEALHRLAGDVREMLKTVWSDPERARDRANAERLYATFVGEKAEHERRVDRERTALKREHARQQRTLTRVAAKAATREELRDVAKAARQFTRRMRRERTELRERVGPSPTWPAFLRTRADLGDDVAIAMLFRMHERERDLARERAPLRLELERNRAPIARTIDGYRYRVERDGTVAYVDDRGAVGFRDKGSVIEVVDAAAARGALTIARVDLRAPIGIRGDHAFRERALRQAVELDVRVSDRELRARAIEIARSLARSISARSAHLAIE